MPKIEVIRCNMQRDYLRSKGWKVRWMGGEQWYRPFMRDTPVSLQEAYKIQNATDQKT